MPKKTMVKGDSGMLAGEVVVIDVDMQSLFVTVSLYV